MSIAALMECVQIGNATLYHGGCAEVLPGLPGTHVVVSDPPYGMKCKTDSRRFSGGHRNVGDGRDWPRIVGDDEPFDPAPLLRFARVVLFGANHFGQRLPVGTTLVWIKRNPPAFGSFLSDAEVAWMKGGHGVYCHLDASSNGAGANYAKYHPTQKPVGVMSWCLVKAKVTPSDTVVDPYMGSGTTGVACANAGVPFIGVELVREYFDAACERIERAQAQGRLAL